MIPCNSSPAVGNINKRKKSTIEFTVISDCPTPTVSTRITSKPAASQIIIASFVDLATPPSVEPDAVGRIKACSRTDKRSIRVLSPNMLPFELSLEGSILKTATFFPAFTNPTPKDSIKVLLPTPGTPVIPILSAFPEYSKQLLISSFDFTLSCFRLLSIKVIAFETSTLFPVITPLKIVVTPKASL